MIREGVFKPLVGSIGALGISSETSADLGKERRTTTKAPPGETLMAVANSRESLPFPSRVRTKTGMASCNRAPLRSSFFDKLRGTYLVHHIKRSQHPEDRTSGAKLGEESSQPGITPNPATDTEITEVTSQRRNPMLTSGHTKKVQRFSLRSLFWGCFQLTVWCT
jgi:hypothetical protein